MLWAAPLALFGQDCAAMYDYFQEGVTLEYTNYNKKGKVESVMTQKVMAIEEEADTLIATFDLSSTDEKGKELFRNSFPVKCHAGVIYMDMRSIIPPNQGSADGQDMQIEVQSTDMVFPPDMKPGQTLPDAEMQMTMRMGGMQLMSTRYTISNRKVEAEESITTAAGTYKCLKISYDLEYKLLGTRTIHTEYWYSTAVGMVQTISYDKKGNVDGRMVLTNFKS